MTSGDASFTAPFKLVAERDDYIHALVAYFDVSFTKCHRLTGFSTGTSYREPFWKSLRKIKKSQKLHSYVVNSCFNVLKYVDWTGPRSKATHWKQTVLYLEDVLTICQGECIVGSMSVSQNKNNHRDVDITLKYLLNGRRCVVSRTQSYKMRWYVCLSVTSSRRFVVLTKLFISVSKFLFELNQSL